MLTETIDLINAVQKQLRSVIAASAWREIPRSDEVRQLSDQLQRERRKLRKMLAAT